MGKKLNSTTKIVLILTICAFAIPAICYIIIFMKCADCPPFLYIVSFILFLGDICCVLGVIAGFAGIFDKKSNIVDKLICIVCVLLFLFSLFPTCFMTGPSREDHRRISCSLNLKEISAALQQYAADYAGYYPPLSGADGLEVLRKNDYLTDYAVYLCPSTTTARNKDGRLTEENVDYVYIGGLNTKSDPNLPLLYDKAINHNAGNPEDFGNVLFADGTVKGIEGDPWTQNIKK